MLCVPPSRAPFVRLLQRDLVQQPPAERQVSCKHREYQIEALPERIRSGEFTLQDLLETAREAVDKGVVEEGFGFWHRPLNGPDFWEFYYRRALPRETRNYIPIILAMIVIAENPGEYGLDDIAPDPPLEYNTITMGARTHLGLIADILGVPPERIQELNPAILRSVAPAGYAVHVPKGTGNLVLSALETVPAGVSNIRCR